MALSAFHLHRTKNRAAEAAHKSSGKTVGDLGGRGTEDTIRTWIGWPLPGVSVCVAREFLSRKTAMNVLWELRPGLAILKIANPNMKLCSPRLAAAPRKKMTQPGNRLQRH